MSDLAETAAAAPAAIILPDAVLKPACQRCRWSAPEQGALACRRNPPQVTIVMVPVEGNALKLQPQRMGFTPQPLAAFPFVHRDMWCGAFELAAAKMD